MPGVIAGVAAGAAGLGLAAGGWMYASLWPTSQTFGRTLIAGDNPRDVALTFDDGPNDAATPELLEVLARHGVQATFFAIGNYARQKPELVRQELADCNAVLEDIAGAAVRFFRPPFGARRPLVLQAARELGLVPVMWNVTGYDWNPIGMDGILKNLDAGMTSNRAEMRSSNLLLHDGSHRGMSWERMDTVRAVDRLLTSRQGTDTRFVTVAAWATAAG